MSGLSRHIETFGALLLAVIWISPLVFAFWAAFHTTSDAVNFNIAAPWTLENFRTAWAGAPWLKYFLNTFLLVTVILIGQFIVTTLAGFAFAQVRFPGRDLVFILVLMQLFILPEVLIVENYVMVSRLGLFDTILGVGMPYMASAFGIFLMRQAFKGVPIDLDLGMEETLKTLSKYPVTTPVALTGTIIVARDIAHAKLKEILEKEGDLPDYIKQYPVYYAGPAKTPAGMASGSFGPTTAGRMDSYVDLFQSHGGSMVMLAKGNRSQAVTDACKKHGGFYLGSAGGPAALLAQDHIKSQEVVAFPELGMEAVWKITVENFPAFILVDDKGHDFFTELNSCPVCK